MMNAQYAAPALKFDTGESGLATAFRYFAVRSLANAAYAASFRACAVVVRMPCVRVTLHPIFLLCGGCCICSSHHALARLKTSQQRI
jgi:hypothetical protein